MVPNTGTAGDSEASAMPVSGMAPAPVTDRPLCRGARPARRSGGQRPGRVGPSHPTMQAHRTGLFSFVSSVQVVRPTMSSQGEESSHRLRLTGVTRTPE